MAADTRPLVPRALVLGVLVFLGGAVFLADSLGLLGASSGWALWPVGIVLLGLVVALQPGTASRAIGLLLLVAGIWLLLNAVGLWSLAFWDTWPVLLILLGAGMLYGTRSMRQRAGGAEGFDRPRTGAEHVGALAFLSEVQRATTGQVLRSGELLAIAGGCVLDLTDARRGADPIVVDVFIAAGRLRLVVPAGWVVRQRVLLVVGRATDGRGDGTEPDGAAGRGDEPVDLLIQGTAILGSVQVVVEAYSSTD